MTLSDMQWAINLANNKCWVLHTKTGTIGKTIKCYGEGEYYAEGSSQPTKGCVLEFEEGHTFCAYDEKHFARLNDLEVKTYQVVKEAIIGTVGELALFAASMGVEKYSFEVIVKDVLLRQIRAVSGKQ